MKIEMKKLLSVSHIINSSVNEFEGERPYLKTGNLNDDGSFVLENFSYEDKPSRANQNVRVNDIIFARMENTKKVLVIEEATKDIIVSTGFVVLRLDKSIIDPVYLYYVINSEMFQKQKNKYCKGATQKAINNQGLSKIMIPVPDLEEQRRIAACLNKTYSLINNRKEAIVKLDELVQSYFLNVVGPLAKGYKDWKKIKVQDVAKSERGSMRTGPFGSDLKHSEFVGEGIAVLGIDNAVKNHFTWGERRFITQEKYEKLKRYTVKPKDVIITIMGTTGRSAVIPEEIPLAITTKHLATITLNRDIALPEFLSYAIHSHPEILYQIMKANKGAIMNGLNLTVIKGLELNLPPLEEQKKFQYFYTQIQSQRESMMRSLTLIEESFQSLLQLAFKGELSFNKEIIS